MIVWICVIIIILIYRYKVAHFFSLVLGSCFCYPARGGLSCNGIFIPNHDSSGPSLMGRCGLLWEPWMLNIFNKYADKNKVALDIGAHIGVHTMALSKRFKMVYAFEPNVEIISSLYYNTEKLPNVVVIDKAVGDTNKIVNFNKKGISSHSYVENFTAPVLQLKLDDCILQRPIGMIKIDIEGGEINAFKGMTQLIKEDSPIIIYEDHTGKTTEYVSMHYKYKIIRIGSSDYLAIPRSEYLKYKN